MATCMFVTLPVADVVSSAIEFITVSTVWSSEDDMLISSFVSSSCSVEIAITYANHVILKQVEKIIHMPVQHSLVLPRQYQGMLHRQIFYSIVESVFPSME